MMTAGQKAARTRKLREAGRKAAHTRKRREAGRKVATVLIERAEGSNVKEAKVVIEKVIDALKPMLSDVRIRVACSPSTLREDRRWRV